MDTVGKYDAKIATLNEATGFKMVNLSRSVMMWKDDAPGTMVYLSDSKNDTFCLEIGKPSDWKDAVARDLAIQYFVARFPDLTDELRKMLDKSPTDPKLKTFVKEMQKAGLQGEKFGYPVAADKEVKSAKKESVKKEPAKKKESAGKKMSKDELKKLASRIAKEQGVEVVSKTEVQESEVE